MSVDIVDLMLTYVDPRSARTHQAITTPCIHAYRTDRFATCIRKGKGGQLYSGVEGAEERYAIQAMATCLRSLCHPSMSYRGADSQVD